jgi:hypothetical protein
VEENDNELVANGIDGATGGYLLPPMKDAEVAEVAASQPPAKEEMNLLRGIASVAGNPHLGALFDVDLTKPEEAGWGIVFHTNEDPAVKTALQPLIEHRQKQISDTSLVKLMEYRDGETVPQWLVRYEMGVGDIDPTRVPFYILLVGSPAKIPFLFGHLLDAVYGVGRLCFDTPEQYAAYAKSVVAYETASSAPTTRDVYFFGPRHVADKPTKLSSTSLVQPLGAGDSLRPSVLDRLAKSRFKLSYNGHYLDPDASTKEALHDIVRGTSGLQAPCLLFTASHGVGWPLGDPRQSSAQGALLCQDFPGAGFGPVKPEHYFAASDLPADAHMHGLVCFHFACYGIGTPKEDRFTHKDGEAPRDIAPESFFSALPQALLTHPNGGALGVIGHVERAWPNSITMVGVGVQLLPFVNALSFILIGNPLGYALKDFNERYAALSTNLGAMLEKKSFGLDIPDSDLASTWTSRNDAEAYVLFGDPGVRIHKDLTA